MYCFGCRADAGSRASVPLLLVLARPLHLVTQPATQAHSLTHTALLCAACVGFGVGALIFGHAGERPIGSKVETADVESQYIDGITADEVRREKEWVGADVAMLGCYMGHAGNRNSRSMWAASLGCVRRCPLPPRFQIIAVRPAIQICPPTCTIAAFSPHLTLHSPPPTPTPPPQVETQFVDNGGCCGGKHV